MTMKVGVAVISGSVTPASSQAEILADSNLSLPTSSAASANAKSKNAFHADVPSQKHPFWYLIIDVFVCFGFNCPFTVAFWQGVWTFCDFWSSVWDIGPWLSMVIGYGVSLTFYLLQEPFKHYITLRNLKTYWIFYPVTRILLFINCFVGVNQWRGFWTMMDLFTGINIPSAIVCFIVGMITLYLMKCLRMSFSPPVYIKIDRYYEETGGTIWDCLLWMSGKFKGRRCRFVVECILIVFVVDTAIIAVWRGCWTVADLLLYPDIPLWSASISLGIGYFICITFCAGRPTLYTFARENTEPGCIRLYILDMFDTYGLIGCIFAWRGWWNFYNVLNFTESLLIKNTTVFVCGFIGNLFLGAASNAMFRGIYKDGEICNPWPLAYTPYVRRGVHHQRIPLSEPLLFRWVYSKLSNCSVCKK